MDFPHYEPNSEEGKKADERTLELISRPETPLFDTERIRNSHAPQKEEANRDGSEQENPSRKRMDTLQPERGWLHDTRLPMEAAYWGALVSRAENS